MPSITCVAACRAPGWEPGAREFESLAGCLSTAWEAGAEGLKSGQTIAGVKIVKRKPRCALRELPRVRA